MSDIFIRGLKRTIARGQKDNDQQLIIDKSTATKEVPANFDEAYRVKIITQTINHINKQKEANND